MKNFKTFQRQKRHVRILARMTGTASRPRLTVYRSLKFHYATLVDDQKHKVLLSVSDAAKTAKVKGKKSDRAKEVGKLLAKKALEKGIQSCIFDRAGYKYHGRVKMVAEGAREGGLKF